MLPPPTFKLLFLTALHHFVEARCRCRIRSLRIDADLVLLLESAPGVDFGDARHGPHVGFDDPVVHRAQVGQAVASSRRAVMKDFAQPRGDRPHLGRSMPGGNLDVGQPLVDQLPGEVDIRAVVERDDDLRQAELRHASAIRPSPGKPPMANSTGKVICRSISSGTSAAAGVLICTCTGVVSGKASKFIARTERSPATPTTNDRKSTAQRCLSDQLINQIATACPQ